MNTADPTPWDAQSRRWLSRGLLGISLLTTIATVADIDWSGRPFVAVAFFLLVPGTAVVGAVGLDDALSELTVGAAVSIAVSTFVAMVMLWLRAWDPSVAQVLLAAVTAPLLARSAWPDHRWATAGWPERWELPGRSGDDEPGGER